MCRNNDPFCGAGRGQFGFPSASPNLVTVGRLQVRNLIKRRHHGHIRIAHHFGVKARGSEISRAGMALHASVQLQTAYSGTIETGYQTLAATVVQPFSKWRYPVTSRPRRLGLSWTACSSTGKQSQLHRIVSLTLSIHSLVVRGAVPVSICHCTPMLSLQPVGSGPDGWVIFNICWIPSSVSES
jgi:hypothetical protein